MEDAPNRAVRHILDRPELAPLWQAVHQRLSSGHPVQRVSLGPLDPAAREALADLMGLDRLPPARTTVTMARLDSALLESVGTDARAVAETILGPTGDRAARRRSGVAERDALWHWLESHPVVAGRPSLAAWSAQIRRSGLVHGSTTATRRLLEAALTVLEALPAQGEPLPVFAAALLGDSHALDDGTRLAGLVLRALTALHDTGPAPSDGKDLQATAAGRRTLWGLAGIADDALSSTVLTAGLRPSGTSPVARALRVCTDAGHAMHLTLAQLRDTSTLLLPMADVHITENPSIVALALRRFGAGCPPLVCTSGWPGSAALLLLRHLSATRARLHYHGDFDGEGLRIATHVMKVTGAQPWHMSCADYQAALADNASGPPAGRVTAAPWDGDLAAALVARGTAVLEEQMAGVLMDDLAGYAGG
ncbi:TIGR02679 family protein [Streptomyces smaragdinus]|uniref:TIGR02679 family protein n=1 Tax=Streptomyces smaragdinus TaxID=2585196 RepID=UPI002B1F9A2C|nr:TIGR02679 family protein [Streptomyces smaragdinus]